MRPVQQLVHTRTRIGQRFALFPLDGYPASRLPNWPAATVRVLASPAMGAGFVQYLIEMPANTSGSFPHHPELETFYYVLSGRGDFINGFGIERGLAAGSFGLTPPGRSTHITASDPMRLLILRKKFETAP